MAFFRSLAQPLRGSLRILTAGCLTLLFFAARPARAESAAAPAEAVSIGQVKSARGQVFLLRGQERRPLQAGEAVQEHDVIETGPDGGVGITFTDNTIRMKFPTTKASLSRIPTKPSLTA